MQTNERKRCGNGEAGNTGALFWILRISPGAGGADRRHPGRSGCVRDHAHRRRKKHLLSAAGLDAARYHPGGLTADLFDAGSGAGAEGSRCACGLYQQHADRYPGSGSLP